LALLLLAFGSYLILVSSFPQLTRETHLSHLLQGLLASILVAGCVVWYLNTQREPPFSTPSDSTGGRTITARVDRLRRHALWFVHVRWVAAVASLALILVAVLVARILPQISLVPLLTWWVVLVSGNVIFADRLHRVQDLEKEIVLQAGLDLVVLTAWLNASGGMENPFYHLYVLHVIIAGILLPKHKAMVVTLAACLLFSALVLAEYLRIVPHVTIGLFPHNQDLAEHTQGAEATLHASHDPVFVLGGMIPFLAMLALVSYLTTLIADRLRWNEDELEEAARSEALERRRLEAVIHSAGIGVVLIDPDLTLRWYGGRAAEWLGLNREFIGKRCDARTDEHGCASLVAETAQTGRAMETERVVKLPRGEVRHFRHATWPVVDPEGCVQQVVKLVEDITTRKLLEAEAVHAGKLSALGKMSAVVAHEINNPLASLSSRLSLMERNEDPSFHRESVGVLRSQIGRISRIVHTVSQFARPPMKRRSTWEVNAAVEEVLNMVRLDPRAAKVRLEWEPNASPLLVTAVRDQLLQCYLNLLLNAVEAVPDDGRVTVRVLARDSEVGVEVEDRGPGIDPTMEDRLFEPFTTTKPSGTGIGLAISQSLVRAHGGRIEVRSERGKGSCFTVFLQAAQGKSLTPESPRGNTA
jgi:signal transduction histidine kinase